jgi:hypothetical protein
MLFDHDMIFPFDNCVRCFMWCWLETHPGLAAWFGSVSTLVAVIVAAATIFLQHRNALSAERAKRDTEEAMALLSLWYMTKEVRQMITLAAYQINEPGNRIIYPDIAEEFSAIRSMLDRLPAERIAARGCVGEWFATRRAATELAKIYKIGPQQGDGFYFLHRNRFEEILKTVRITEEEIAENVRQFAPSVYEQHAAGINHL